MSRRTHVKKTVEQFLADRGEAEKQAKFKPLIDKMKLLRADLAVYSDLSATAAYEGARATVAKFLNASAPEDIIFTR